MYFYGIFTAGIDASTESYMVYHNEDFSQEKFEKMILDVVPEAIPLAKEYTLPKLLENRARFYEYRKKPVPTDSIIVENSMIGSSDLYKGIRDALCLRYGFKPVSIHRYYGLDAYFDPTNPRENDEFRGKPGIKSERELALWTRVQECLKEN